ncbi:MAG: hypothetical protein LUE92_16155 [Clostridiales bacterium]|nr:hypothetical protein [Clostridiales bacterium]
MQDRLEIGSHVFLIESSRIVTEVIVSDRRGGFYTVRFPGQGAIRVRRSRLFLTKKEAEERTHDNRQTKRSRTPYDYC